MFLKSLTTKINVMEGKIVGIILSILGIASLVLALVAINGMGEGSQHVTTLLAAGIGGAAAFFAGIWLVDYKRSKDKAGKPGLMRVSESPLQQQ